MNVLHSINIFVNKNMLTKKDFSRCFFLKELSEKSLYCFFNKNNFQKTS
jgi:hypothetical protein